MKYSFATLSFALFLLSLATGADGPQVADGKDHGDPPYLLENGWTPLLNGKNLDGWRYYDDRGGWTATKGVLWGGTTNPRQLLAMPEPGDRIVNTGKEVGRAANLVAMHKFADLPKEKLDFTPFGPSNLVTKQRFGDLELYLEFMCADRSNSGAYIHGLYEVQITDSYGRDANGHFTNYAGAIYNYQPGSAAARAALSTAKPVPDGWKPFGGVPPRIRAERPAGQWQSFHIWFQAPRFDAAGKKTANAKFLRVIFNGTLIQEMVERLEPTQEAMNIPEASMNPIMLQGDHGPIAFRNIYIRPLRALP